MNEMVERVAKVIRVKYHGYDCGMDRCRADSIEQAKAAIEAMKEPTDDMIGSAGIVKNGEYLKAWRDMIEAVLKDD